MCNILPSANVHQALKGMYNINICVLVHQSLLTPSTLVVFSLYVLSLRAQAGVYKLVLPDKTLYRST